MRLAVANRVERVLQRPHRVIEGAVGILVRPVGVGDRRELDDDVRLDGREVGTDQLIVARVHDVERDIEKRQGVLNTVKQRLQESEGRPEDRRNRFHEQEVKKWIESETQLIACSQEFLDRYRSMPDEPG